MLTLVFNWIYILFTCFCLGMAFAWFVDKTLHYTIRGLDSILGAGLLTATVYAQVFSLLGPVGLWANLVLLCACLELFPAPGRGGAGPCGRLELLCLPRVQGARYGFIPWPEHPLDRGVRCGEGPGKF